MSITLKRKLSKVTDLTDGRKPEKNEEIVIIQIGNGEYKLSYKIIGKKFKPPKPLTPHEKRAEIESRRVMGMLGWDCIFGKASGPGYYFH